MVDKLNVAIEAYHTAHPDAPRCDYCYIQFALTMRLNRQSV